MPDVWIDPVDPVSQQGGRRPRAMTMVLGAAGAVLVLVVIVWLRFLSGASAAPVPTSVGSEVPEVAAASAAITPATEPSAGSSASPAHQQTTTTTTPQLSHSYSVEPSVSSSWLAATAAATGISARALQAYAGAELELEREKPACHLGWNTLAGIGRIESNNGRVLTAAGYSTSPILGPSVAGGQHAEGPMQFMPGTWARWGADGNGDGVKDPNQIDDAALAAARYLCSYGQLNTATGWHAAVFGYNHLNSYVAAVAAQATLYAQRAASVNAGS